MSVCFDVRLSMTIVIDRDENLLDHSMNSSTVEDRYSNRRETTMNARSTNAIEPDSNEGNVYNGHT
jgi:hypothetical protein